MNDSPPYVPKKPQWYVTAVFSALALSFLVTSFRSVPLHFWQSAVLSIGNESMRVSEFRQKFLRKMDLARSYKLGAPDLKELLIQEVIREKVLQLEIQRLGIQVSEKTARESLQQRFLGANGVFEEGLMRRYMEHYHLAVPQLIQEEQDRLGVERLRRALAHQIPRVEALSTLTAKGFFQQRRGRYKVFPLEEKLSSKQKLSLGQPSQEELKTMFAQQTFRAPQQRVFTFLHLDPETLKKRAEVSPEELQGEITNLQKAKGKKTLSSQEKAQAHGEAQNKKARYTVEQLFLKIEEELNMGDSLATIAQRHHLPLITVQTDAKGRGLQGTRLAALDFPKSPQGSVLRKNMLQKVFSLSDHNEPDWLQMPWGETVFFMVEKTIPEKTLSLEEAQPMLQQNWLRQRTQASLMAKAQNFLATLTANTTSLGKNASKKKPSMVPIPFMSLSTKEQEKFPAVVKKALFALAPGQAMVVYDKKNAYVVVLDAVEENQDAAKVADMSYLSQRELQALLWHCYGEDLKKKYPVTVHKNALRESLGPLFQEEATP